MRGAQGCTCRVFHQLTLHSFLVIPVLLACDCLLVGLLHSKLLQLLLRHVPWMGLDGRVRSCLNRRTLGSILLLGSTPVEQLRPVVTAQLPGLQPVGW